MKPHAGADPDFAWFLKADLSAFEGEYVAIANAQVVSHGDDPGVVYDEAERRFPGRKVILWKVMPQGVYVFTISARECRFPVPF
jgi:hypothetical protein